MDSRETQIDAVAGGAEGSRGADASSGAMAGAAPTSSVEPLQSRIDELENRLFRAKADFANLQRSSAIEREQAIRYANADLIRSLLNVVDDFERSLTIEAKSGDAVKLRDGVRLVYENMLKALRERGVEVIDPLHQPFDPTYHEALMRQPSADHPTGTVLTVLARGYRMGDRLLRAARVVIAAEPQPAEAR
ncbi:MAG: nucleotide exchange factor GrpE [Phycisphaerales bacterium]|nr:nucleotide exchange factor GrpE [Phycisphaerales bacterium]